MAEPLVPIVRDRVDVAARTAGEGGSEGGQTGLHRQLRQAGHLDAQDALLSPGQPIQMHGQKRVGVAKASAEAAPLDDVEVARLYAGVDPRLARIVGELLGVSGEPPTVAFLRAVEAYQQKSGIAAETPGVLDAETVDGIRRKPLRSATPELLRKLIQISDSRTTQSSYRASFRNGADANEDGTGVKHAMVSKTFLGKSLTAHPMLHARLAAVEARLRNDLQALLADPEENVSLARHGIVGTTEADLGRWLGIHQPHTGWRRGKGQGYHRYGTALDVNRDTNAWMAVRSGLIVGGEGTATSRSAAAFDRQGLEVIDRASLFMTKRRAELHVSTARTPEAAESRQCRTHGLCAFDERSVRCASTAASCRASTVCQQLGWCEPEQGRGPAVTGLWDGVERRDAACYAATCEGTPPCERWGACHTDPLGGCVVAPQEPVPCQTHRVLGLTATATSERAPDGQHYDAGRLVDRDSRTAWVAAEGKAAGETVTIRLPRPERVTRVYIRNSHELQDPTRGDLREHFGRIIHAVVRAGATVEMFNDVRTGVIGPPERYGIPVVLPPTLTDTVTIEVQLVSAGYERAEPAITEVVIEACDAPEAPPAPRSP